MPSPDSSPEKKEPTKSAFLRTYPGRRIKKVRWDRSVVLNDNKKKRARSRSPHPKKEARTVEVAVAFQQPSSTPKPTMEQRPPVLAAASRQKSPNQRPGHLITSVSSTQHPVDVSVRKISRFPTTQPQRTYVQKSRAQLVETQKLPGQQLWSKNASNIYLPYIGITKTEARRHAGVKDHTGVTGNVLNTVEHSTVPPAVPDSPMRLQKPPPAPRPERLPTPDLPDIGGAYFCDDPYCHGCLSKVRDNELYPKMNPQSKVQ